MKKFKETGTIADIPLRSTSRLYFVRVENEQPVDEGWVTVDEAKTMNATDRRMHGSPMNRYFQDAEAATTFSASLGQGPIDQMPPEPMNDFGAGIEDPAMGGGEEFAPDNGMGLGGEDDMGMGLGGEEDLGLGGEEDLGLDDEADFDMDMEDDALGDLGDDEDLLDDEEDGVLEIRVPRKIRLVPESMQEKIPTFRGEPRFSNPPNDDDLEGGGEELADETEIVGGNQARGDWFDEVISLIKQTTGLDSNGVKDAMTTSDFSGLLDVLEDAWERKDRPQKALAILQDFGPFKPLVRSTEPEEEPWSEAPAGSINPASYQMDVSQVLMQNPNGPQILDKMMKDPSFYEAMSEIMMDGINRGSPPEKTARNIVDMFQQRGDMGTGGGGEDWGPDLPWAESMQFEDLVDETFIPPQFRAKCDNKAAKAKRAKRKAKKETAETTEAGLIEAYIDGLVSSEDLIEQTMGTAGQVGYNTRDQGILGKQVAANTQMKAPQAQWGQQQQQQQPGAQIPQELQPMYQQYTQALQSGDTATAQRLKGELAWELQLQGVDPKQVLQ